LKPTGETRKVTTENHEKGRTPPYMPFQKRPGVDRIPGGCRNGVHQGRDGAGDEGAGSDFAGDQQGVGLSWFEAASTFNSILC